MYVFVTKHAIIRYIQYMNTFKSLIAFGLMFVASSIVLAQVSVGGYAVTSSQPAPICTADAKLCADGSYVGRSGPNCAFICPEDGAIPPSVTNECIDLKYNMYLRSKDSQTKGETSLLQDFLSPNYFGQDPTGYFGTVTLNSVQKFQRANGLLSYGYVGPATRAKIKMITCGNVESFGIKVIQPNFVKVGDTVTLFGPGLNVSNAYVTIDGYRVEANIQTVARNTVSFVVPEYLSHTINCIKAPCPLGLVKEVVPGNYSIRVVNSNGTSNEAILTIRNKDVGGPISLSSLNPTSGKIGQEVVIYGQGINVGDDKIYFGNSIVPQYTTTSADVVNVLRFKVPGSLTSCSSSSSDTCYVVPVTPGSYNITVKNSRGTSNTLSFTVTSSTTNPPTITSFSPSASVTGTQVTLTGTGFTSTGNKVNFGQSGDINGLGYDSVDGRTLTFLVPVYSSNIGWANQPGGYAVSVSNANGVSNTLIFNVISYGFESPLITKFQAETISTTQGGARRMLVWTTQFTNSCTASGAWSGSWPVNGSSEIGFMSQPLTYTLTCVNSQGSSVSRSVTDPTNGSTVVPVVTSLSPTTGPIGTRVTVYGSNINTNSEYVLFDGFRIATDGSSITNQVSFIVPEYLSYQCNRIKPTDPCPDVATRQVIPGAYSVQVGNTNGISNTNTFTVTSATVPTQTTLISLTGSNSFINTSAEATITNFVAGSVLSFTNSTSNNSITERPLTLKSGTNNIYTFSLPGTPGAYVNIRVKAPSGDFSNALNNLPTAPYIVLQQIINPPPVGSPTITSIFPTSARIGDTVTITGTGFTPQTTVFVATSTPSHGGSINKQFISSTELKYTLRYTNTYNIFGIVDRINISVRDIQNQGQFSNSVQIALAPHPDMPVITSISPTQITLPGTFVVNGSNLLATNGFAGDYYLVLENNSQNNYSYTGELLDGGSASRVQINVPNNSNIIAGLRYKVYITKYIYNSNGGVVDVLPSNFAPTLLNIGSPNSTQPADQRF